MSIKRKDGYISGSVQAASHRWEALLDAALEQPHPTPELRAALEGLKVRPRPSHFAWLHRNNPVAFKEMARRGGLQNGKRAIA